jgi:hypothetical protein
MLRMRLFRGRNEEKRIILRGAEDFFRAGAFGRRGERGAPGRFASLEDAFEDEGEDDENGDDDHPGLQG